MRHACLLAVLTIGVSTPASAQTVFEGAAGYSVLDYRHTDGTPVGWFISFAAKPTQWFAVVSQLTAEFQTDGVGTRTTKTQAFAFLDGPRLTIPRHKLRGRVEVFGEVLIGVAHDREFFPERSDANRFVWQPGAGVDLALSNRLSARFQANWRYPCCEEGRGKSFATAFMSGIAFSGRRTVDRVEDAIRRQTKAMKEFDDAESRRTRASDTVTDARAQLGNAQREEALAALDKANAALKEAEARAEIARSRLQAATAAIDAARADLAGQR